MAYFTNYIIPFNSPRGQSCQIILEKKTAPTLGVQYLSCANNSVLLSNETGDGDRFDCINSQSLNFALLLDNKTNLTYDEFLVTYYDEMRCTLVVNGQVHFIGFVLPREQQVSFIDKPYIVEILASDMLGMLKDVPLSIPDGKDSFVDIISLCLEKTGLELDIEVQAGLENYHNSIYLDWGSNWFNLDYRTFQNSATTYVSCYEALERMLLGFFSIRQNGNKWLIYRIGELQANVGVNREIQTYNYQGVPLSQYTPSNVPKYIGKPINRSVLLQKDYPVKRVTTQFDYKVFPELPLNNKFERGELYVDTPTNKQYYPNDWVEFITWNGAGNPIPITGSSRRVYYADEYDLYDILIDKTLVLPAQVGGDTKLVSSPILAKKGDRVSFGASFLASNFGNPLGEYVPLFSVFLRTSGATHYELDNIQPTTGSDFVVADQAYWVAVSSNRPASNFNIRAQVNNYEWSSVSVESAPLPEDGELYIGFRREAVTYLIEHYRDFNFSYTPFVAGGYREITGINWITETNQQYIDEIDHEVMINDAYSRVIQGVPYYNFWGGNTNASWRRVGKSESRSYAEIANLDRYNSSWRPMLRIEGDFINENLEMYAFNQHYRIDSLPTKYFSLVPPFSVDYAAGVAHLTLLECIDTTLGNSDGNQLGDNHFYKYIFK